MKPDPMVEYISLRRIHETWTYGWIYYWEGYMKPEPIWLNTYHWEGYMKPKPMVEYISLRRYTWNLNLWLNIYHWEGYMKPEPMVEYLSLRRIHET